MARAAINEGEAGTDSVADVEQFLLDVLDVLRYPASLYLQMVDRDDTEVVPAHVRLAEKVKVGHLKKCAEVYMLAAEFFNEIDAGRPLLMPDAREYHGSG